MRKFSVCDPQMGSGKKAEHHLDLYNKPAKVSLLCLCIYFDPRQMENSQLEVGKYPKIGYNKYIYRQYVGELILLIENLFLAKVLN